MLSQLWKWLAIALAGVSAFLLALQRTTDAQKEKAERKADKATQRADTAEGRIAQRNKADTASQHAKEQSDDTVEQVKQSARSGQRDHFASGWLHDDRDTPDNDRSPDS